MITAELVRRRAEARLSLADVGRAAYVSRGYVHHVEQGHRWPSRSIATALDAALGAGGALLATWQTADLIPRSVRADGTAVASQQAEDTDVALVSAADESARFLAWAEASNTGDLTVEQMHADVRWIAHSYLKVPTLPLFARARAIRDHASSDHGLPAGGRRGRAAHLRARD